MRTRTRSQRMPIVMQAKEPHRLPLYHSPKNCRMGRIRKCLGHFRQIVIPWSFCKGMTVADVAYLYAYHTCSQSKQGLYLKSCYHSAAGLCIHMQGPFVESTRPSLSEDRRFRIDPRFARLQPTRLKCNPSCTSLRTSMQGPFADSA